jgi:asparagine synthase (glutamine-hydrolysing)
LTWRAAISASGATGISNSSPAYEKPDEAVEDLRALIKESVRRRLMSDVPLGVFLSGGLDSTTVVACMRELGVSNIKSFSIAYPDPTFSELEYAEDMARHYGTESEVLMIPGLSLDDLEAAVYHLDEPMTDLSAIPLMLICRKARQKVTVVLSGEGGDEVSAATTASRWPRPPGSWAWTLFPARPRS